MQRAAKALAGPSGQMSAAAPSGQAETPDRTRKGPPLASRSHTLQLAIMLFLNSILLLTCLYVLPAHLLWRRASKLYASAEQHESILGEASNLTTPVTTVVSEAVKRAGISSATATQNIITAFGLLFKAPQNDENSLSWIKGAFRSALAAAALGQGWFVARFKGWWEEAEAMERGDRDEVLKRRRRGISSHLEHVTLATFALPLPLVAVSIALILAGAPMTRNYLDTLFLSAYICVLIFLPAFALLGTEEDEWIKAFSWSRQGTPRFKLLAVQVFSTLIGVMIGSAGLLLDWERAWQVYPVPPILGACLGRVIGNTLGFLSYYRSLPSASPRVELRARSAVKSGSNKKKKR